MKLHNVSCLKKYLVFHCEISDILRLSLCTRRLFFYILFYFFIFFYYLFIHITTTKNKNKFELHSSCIVDVLLMEFMYLVFTRMPGESYRIFVVFV